MFQNFRMKSEPETDPIFDGETGYAQECGARLVIIRKALGYASPIAFVRYLSGDDNIDKDDWRVSKYTKWEKDTLVRPWFVRYLHKRFGVSLDYIYADDYSSMRGDWTADIERVKKEKASRVGRKRPKKAPPGKKAGRSGRPFQKKSAGRRRSA